MKELNLADIYRILHPNTKTCTYESKSLNLKSRIDYFIISKELSIATRRVESIPRHKSLFPLTVSLLALIQLTRLRSL